MWVSTAEPNNRRWPPPPPRLRRGRQPPLHRPGHCVTVQQMQQEEKPRGELVTQTIAMPRDTNRNGDIFGGWLVSQMDLGGAILAAKIAKARVVTVAME